MIERGDGVLGDAPHSAWSQDLDQISFRCAPFVEEAEFLHRESHTLIMGDYIQDPRSPLSYVTRPLVQISRTGRALRRRQERMLKGL